jgi:hypothetical protein
LPGKAAFPGEILFQFSFLPALLWFDSIPLPSKKWCFSVEKLTGSVLAVIPRRFSFPPLRKRDQ